MNREPMWELTVLRISVGTGSTEESREAFQEIYSARASGDTFRNHIFADGFADRNHLAGLVADRV